LFLILGILLILGGIWVDRTPELSYVTLGMLLIIILLINGIFQIAFSIINREQISGWGWYLTGGVLELLIGIYLWSYPGISLVMLPFVVGFWLLFRGISVIASATDLKNLGIKGWGWVLALGILMTFFAFLMIMDPVFGAFNVIWLTSFAMIFMGFAYITFSFKLKEIKSVTLDVVKDLKGDLNALKKSILDELTDVSDETKDLIAKKFDEYKSDSD
jgi:uncharacterized membrane protein HdeD (DUF308 family)